MVKNRIGEHSNCVPTSSLPTVAAIKPTHGTRRSPLSGNARIFVPANSDRKDHKKESLQISAVPKKTNRGPPEEFHGDERSDARPRVPLKAQREAKEALDSPLFEPPYYGRDWPCICGNNCEPAGSGKLAYKCTGPYKIVEVNPRNPDVYRLVPLGQPNREPTSHHVRELCPYITQEAHERQKPAPVGRHVTSGKTLNYHRPDNRRDQKEQPNEAMVLSKGHDSENKMN